MSRSIKKPRWISKVEYLQYLLQQMNSKEVAEVIMSLVNHAEGRGKYQYNKLITRLRSFDDISK